MRFIGIFSKNRPEWVLTDIACLFYGITSVPIYDTLGDENISYVFNHTNLTTVFVNDLGLKALVKTHDMANVKKIVCYDPFTEDDEKHFDEKGIKLMKYKDLIEIGAENMVDYEDP